VTGKGYISGAPAPVAESRPAEIGGKVARHVPDDGAGALPAKGLRGKTHFASRFKPITLVQPSSEKYSYFVFPENDVLLSRPASP
jgi:hypothetical protein